MKRPLVLFVIIFSCGIISAGLFKVNFWLAYCAAAGLLAVCLFFFRNKAVSALGICFIVFLFGIILSVDNQTLSACNIRNILRKITYERKPVLVLKGTIYNQPVYKNNRTEFIFRAREIQQDNLRYSCVGDILVHMKGAINFHYADELIVYGSLYQPWGDYGRYLQRQGIASVMNVKNAVYLGPSIGDWKLKINAPILALKNELQKVIYKYFNGLEAGVVEAMVLGEKINIPRYINNFMIKTGTVHILVVSGFNVGIIAFVVIIVMKLIRIPKRPRLCVAGLLLVLYCFVTGASTPVVRATIMAIVFISSYFVKRGPDIYNCCSLAAIIILSINPGQLFDIGFQLSFISVISIVYIYPRLKLFLRIDSLKPKFLRFIIDGVLVSFSAWTGTFGFIAYYFKIISPVTVLANLFVVPLASLVTLCGYSLLIADFIFPILANWFSYAAKLLIAALFIINNFLAKLPGAYFYFT